MDEVTPITEQLTHTYDQKGQSHAEACLESIFQGFLVKGDLSERCKGVKLKGKWFKHSKQCIFTVWKFHNFSIIQILREIIFWESKSYEY